MKYDGIWTLALRGGGVDYIHLFSRKFFTAQTRSFQGCLRVWARGDQALRHQCKFQKLAIFQNSKKNPKKCTFSVVFTNLKKVSWFNSRPPSEIRVKTPRQKGKEEPKYGRLNPHYPDCLPIENHHNKNSVKKNREKKSYTDYL